MRTLNRFIILPALMAAMAACSGGGDSPTEPNNGTNGPATVDVFTPGLVFSPAFVTIKLGDTVRWVITGVAHDVTFQAVTGAPQSIPVTQNQSVSRTFNTKGTFPYDCRTHPGMSGSVTVE